jgi:hypothetical protein
MVSMAVRGSVIYGVQIKHLQTIYKYICGAADIMAMTAAYFNTIKKNKKALRGNLLESIFM